MQGRDGTSDTDALDVPIRPGNTRPVPAGPADEEHSVVAEDLPMRPQAVSDLRSDIVSSPSSTTAVASGHGVADGDDYNNDKYAMRPAGVTGVHIPTVAPAIIPTTADERLRGGEGDPKQSTWISEKFKDTPHEWDDAKYWIVLLAVILGLVSYVCQWLFWGGLVKTWGPRYTSIAAHSIYSC
jgi:hypothetical protein